MNELKNTQLHTMSSSELEALLKQTKEKERLAAKKEQEKYIKAQDELTKSLSTIAKLQREHLREFKQKCYKELNAFYDDYLKSKREDTSKGNFTLTSSCGTYKVEFANNITYGFDAQALKAEELIKDFLADTVKKRDRKIYDLVVSLLDKTSKDTYDPRQIQKLYKYENEFDDVRWSQAISIFKSSYKELSSKTYVRFYIKDSSGKYQPISLQFSDIDVIEDEGDK